MAIEHRENRKPSVARRAWSRRAPAAWLIVAGTVAYFWGPAFCHLTWPRSVRVVDFFQDWSTGRNYWQGQPIYGRQDAALARHLGLAWDERSPLLKEGSTRPPSCVLLTLPLGRLNYLAGLRLWNLGGLCCLVMALGWLCRGRRLRVDGLTILRLATFSLVFNPLLVQLFQGQWSLVLLLLLTAAWGAERRGRSTAAGVFLGIATAIKVFPAILVVPFLVRRDGRALGGWTASVALLNLGALLLLGAGAYVEYMEEVLPALTAFRGHALDASLAGFWHRLFAPMVEVGGLRVRPIIAAPVLAAITTGVSRLAILALWVRQLCRPAVGRGTAAADQTFAAGLGAMLLIAPLTWDHYLLMLLPAFVLLWPEPTAAPGAAVSPGTKERRQRLRRSLYLCLALLFVPPTLLHQLCQYAVKQLGWSTAETAAWTAAPWESLVMLSLPTYVLLWLFALGVRTGASEPH